jgi:hypothetical protein
MELQRPLATAQGARIPVNDGFNPKLTPVVVVWATHLRLKKTFEQSPISQASPRGAGGSLKQASLPGSLSAPNRAVTGRFSLDSDLNPPPEAMPKEALARKAQKSPVLGRAAGRLSRWKNRVYLFWRKRKPAKCHKSSSSRVGSRCWSFVALPT